MTDDSHISLLLALIIVLVLIILGVYSVIKRQQTNTAVWQNDHWVSKGSYTLASLQNQCQLNLPEPDARLTVRDAIARGLGKNPRSGDQIDCYGVTFLVMGMFLVIGCVLQKSPQYMNIPNKDHWLSPENRDETIRTITGGMALIGGLAGLLSLVVGQYAIQKNLTPGPIAMDAYIIWLVLGFVGITLVWSISVTVKYMRPPPKHL